MKKILVCCFLILFSASVHAQLGIGTNSPEASAALDISSTEQGLLPPRMTSLQRDAINGGEFAEGLVIYNTDEKCLQYWNGADWKCKQGSSDQSESSNSRKIDSSVAQVFAIDDFKRFFFPSYNSSFKIDALDGIWLDNDQYALLSIVPTSSTSYSDRVIDIYNFKFGKVKRIAVPGLKGTPGGLGGIEKLKNGNLVVYNTSWTPSRNGNCTGLTNIFACGVFVIIDQDGNEIKSLEKIFPSSYTSGVIFRKVRALENGNFIISALFGQTGHGRYTLRTYIFDKNGNLIKQNNEFSIVTGLFYKGAVEATSFGYISILKNKYRAYDFDGNEIKQINNWLPSDSIFLSDTNTWTGLIRVDNDSYVAFNKKAMISFDVTSSNIQLLGEKQFEGKFEPPPISRRSKSVGGVTSDNKILYLGNMIINGEMRKVPIGAFTDGTPLLDFAAGYSMQLYDFNSREINKVLYTALPPGARLIQDRNDNDQYQFYDFSDLLDNLESSMHISPDGKKSLVSVVLHDSSRIFAFFDISDTNNIKQYKYEALNNGVKQFMGKRFILAGPEDNIKQVEIKITKGYQSGDTLHCDCTPTTVASVMIGNTMVLSASQPAPMQHFITSLNEILFSTTAGSGVRTISIQAISENNEAGDILEFDLTVGAN